MGASYELDPTVESTLGRLRRLLGGDDLAALRARLRDRYTRGLETPSFTLGPLTSAERQALEGLLGRSPRWASSMRVSTAELDAAVFRAGLAPDFRSALELLDGPITDRRAQRLAQDEAWESTFAAAQGSSLAALVATNRGRGMVKRLARSSPPAAARLLRQAEAVVARIPASGMPLARLAAETTGDAHALDEGRALAALVLAAVAPEVDADDEPESARPRNRWALLGVSVNELSAPALVLNLPSSGDSPGARLLETGRLAGEPVHLSLRTLLRSPPTWPVGGQPVFVCENPTVVTVAADVLGANTQPLLCTDGMPSASQRTLLRQLLQAGATLHYHGDFDWPGIRIGNWMVRSLGATPWRFGVADYSVLRTGSRRKLEGQPVAALWDSALTAAMTRTGLALEEEAVLDLLLRDLAT